jgi:hypothetical protein
MAKKVSILEILRMSKLTRTSSKIPSNSFADIFINDRRPARSRCIFKSRKTTFLKRAHAVLNSAWTLTEEFRHAIATEPITYKHNPMRPVIISRLFGSQNLLLHSDSHHVCIDDLKPTHDITPFLL